MKEIVLDTETTGLDPFTGDRIIEIGMVELENHIPTGRTYHQYINPERHVPEEVVKIHGIDDEFLKDKPTFIQIADEFLDFIGTEASLVIHNAAFDMKFLNHELERLEKEKLSYDRVIDTLIIARKKYPGQKVNLNELCRRYNIDLSARNFHGALLDCELLAQVYKELLNNGEEGLSFKSAPKIKAEPIQRIFHEPRQFDIPEEEFQNHKNFIEGMKTCLWKN